MEEKGSTHAQYVKTHGNFDPGEQKQRQYNWPVEKHVHRFGYGEHQVLNGAKNAVQPERVDEEFPKTIIIKKTVEDHFATTNDTLGKSKNLG